jgi:hypothetical protein
LRDVAESHAAVPVPLKLTVCGLLGSLSAMTRVADRIPAAVLSAVLPRFVSLTVFREPLPTGWAPKLRLEGVTFACDPASSCVTTTTCLPTVIVPDRRDALELGATK